MRKYLWLFLMLILWTSCSKQVEVKGHIKNPTPLERIEIIEASGVATLPLVNIPVDEKGNFSAKFEAPKNGMYLLAYGREFTMLYLKQGQSLELTGDSMMGFPSTRVVKGDAKANNDFIKNVEDFFRNYSMKLKIDELMSSKEENFIKSYEKIKKELYENIDTQAEKTKADKEVVKYKKMETDTRLLNLLDLFEKSSVQVATNPAHKFSEKFKELKKEIQSQGDELITQIPLYRNVLLGSLSADFQKFAQPKIKNNTQILVSEIFADFLKQRKDLSDTAKDYLFSYIIAENDINHFNFPKYDKITQLIENNVKDKTLISNLKELQKALMGVAKNSTLEMSVLNEKSEKKNLKDFKGKPTLVMFYASYNPNIALMTIPTLEQVQQVYGKAMNFVYVNLDDTKEQFQKTSKSLLKDRKIQGEHYFVEGGINSSEARNLGLYAFAIPKFFLLDKDGKVLDRPYINLADGEFVGKIEKLTGVKFPMNQEVPSVKLETSVPQPKDSTTSK